MYVGTLYKTYSSELNIRIMWRCKHWEPKADDDGDEAGDSGGVWYGCMGSSSSKNPDELPEEVRGYLIIICVWFFVLFFLKVKYNQVPQRIFMISMYTRGGR